MEKVNILIVDDEPLIRKSLYEILQLEGYKAEMAKDGQEALVHLKEENFDIVLADVKMPHMDGLELLKRIKIDSPHTSVILITGYGNIETAVEAMKSGAFDYISKPILDSEIKVVIQKALEQKRLVEENIFLKKKLASSSRSQFFSIFGQDEKMQKIYTLVEAVANTKATVLLTGESGTGKRMIAMAIHNNDKHRKDKLFLEISCGALPADILESELFGHVKGAFTGAIKERMGRFEAANAGTVLLDEIDAFSTNLQVKLLRFLQTGEFERVGDTNTQKVDVRVIAATNRSLDELIKKGEFREDLFYRLNVISIDIPSLRERKSDIPLLVGHFIDKYSKVHHKKIRGVAREVMDIFMEYDWPGNIRELENTIERAMILSSKEIITKDALPENFQKQDNFAQILTNSNHSLLREALRDPEREIILRALEDNSWNRHKTAEILGINRTTLYNKMKKYNLLKNNDYSLHR